VVPEPEKKEQALKPETKPQPKPEPKPEEPKPEVKPEEPQPEVKPEEKPEEPKPEPKPEQKPKPEPEEDPKKKEELMAANAAIKQELKDSQPNNDDFAAAVDRFIPDSSALTPEELKLKVD
jgi:outer membrane biosynthesis protein TonB